MEPQTQDQWTGLYVERRLLRWLLWAYCLFIFYGAFIPFRFDSDPAFLQTQWKRFLAWPFIPAAGAISTPDVIANILFLFPFGFLWISVNASRQPARSPKSAFSRALALGMLVGFAIEIGQTFSPGRTASLLDALCNGFGAGLGGLVAHHLVRELNGNLGILLIQTIQKRPSLVLFALLSMAPLFDAFYPFHITLDPSTIWHSVKQGRWLPFIGEARRLWLDLVMEKALPFAALGFLAHRLLAVTQPSAARLRAWVACCLFALLSEGGKLFFVGRSPSADNFVFSALGAWAGVTLFSTLAQSRWIQRRPRASLLIAFLAVNVYTALSPFDWIGSIAEAQARLARIEWLPFHAYYRADPFSALFDLAKKLFLIGPLGFLIAYRPGNFELRQKKIAVFAGLALGFVLEGIQILLRSRSPSITDVALFGLACWMGAAAFERYRKITTLDIDGKRSR